ncbi:MAG: putative PDDEXK endonuclease [Commensalibacter sp.]
MQRDKGARREREIVHKCIAEGIYAERVPLSGASVFRNTHSTDVDVYARGKHESPLVTEVKARANGEGFKTIKRWLGDADALFLVADREEPLVLLPFKVFTSLCYADQNQKKKTII